jgi:hypothetical protein
MPIVADEPLCIVVMSETFHPPSVRFSILELKDGWVYTTLNVNTFGVFRLEFPYAVSKLYGF